MNTVSDAITAKFSPRRLGHANIQVSDLDRSQRFYSDVMGIELCCLEPGIGAATWSGSSGSAFGALWRFPSKARSATTTSLGCPFSSMSFGL